MDSSLLPLTTCRGSLAGLLIEKCKQKAKMPDMAFAVHIKRPVMNAINDREESNSHTNLWPIAAGALAGALTGYVLSSPRGRRALDEVIVMIDEFSTGWARFSQSCARAELSAFEGWHALRDGITSKSVRTR